MKMLTLVRQQLNVAFNLSAVKWYVKHDRIKVLGGAGIAALLIVSLAPIYFFGYLKLLRSIFSGGLVIGRPELILSLGLVMVSMFVLVFGIAFVMSIFYFSRDLSILIPLPFAPREIIGAKFMVVLVQEYLTVIPLLLPVLYIYGTEMGAGLYYWISGLLVMLMVPVIPLTIVSAAILVLMRVTNLGQRKDFLRMLGMIVLVVIIIGINFFATRIGASSQEDLMALLLADDGLIQFVTRIFPPALIATRAMAAEGSAAFLNLIAFAGLTAAGIALTLFLGDRLFYRGLIGGQEVTARKDLSADQLHKGMSRVFSPVWAIAVREIKTLFRTPIYLFNSVGVLVIAPIAMIVPLLAGDATEPLLQMIQQTDSRMLMNLIGVAMMGIMAAFAPAASSSFSREGRQFWISQMIPVTPGEQIRGKVLYSMILSLLTIPLIILFSVLFAKWTLTELVIIIILGFIVSLPSVTVSLLIDLIRPYLTWENPQKAIKQNMNVVLAMISTGILYFLLYRITMWLYNAQYGDYVIYAGTAAAALILGIIPYCVMLRIAAQRYRDIAAP